MDFVSPLFLFLFLPLFMLVYSLPLGWFKLIIGIAGSLLFYSWGNALYLLLMVGLVLFMFGIALLADRWRKTSFSIPMLSGWHAFTVLVLVAYKLRMDINYPLVLSYVAIQIIAYYVDVYNSADNCEKDLLKFSFYHIVISQNPGWTDCSLSIGKTTN